jgi:DNA polymerase-3 subunit epsilon
MKESRTVDWRSNATRYPYPLTVKVAQPPHPFNQPRNTMKLALFYDTETTGLPLFKEPSEHPDQPHIVQLAACLVDLDTRNTIASMDVIVQPSGFTISDEVAAIHGITTEHAMDVGIPEKMALDMLMALWNERLRIGHNESFDARIVRIAQSRFGKSESELTLWKAGQAECTCWMARPHTKLEKNKLPKLGEAYQHFIGAPMEHAHSAMADVQGCMAVYFAMQDLPAAA